MGFIGSVGTGDAIAAVLFTMISGKNYAPIVWKMIRLRGDVPTYKVDEE